MFKQDKTELDLSHIIIYNLQQIKQMVKNMKTALIVIDMQNDFCPGGALAVEHGKDIIPKIKSLMKEDLTALVFTQDNHPANHSSFASTHNMAPFSSIQMPYGEQTLWPDHCVQGTFGAEVVEELKEELARSNLIIRKGGNPNVDSYSAFFENDKVTSTGLDGYLKSLGVEHVILCGLAYDFCVGYSALDAISLGYKVTVSACASIAMPLEHGMTTESVMSGELKKAGVHFA